MVGHTEMPLWEILEKLKKLDEFELLDLLGLTSEELVEYVQDHVEQDQEKYITYLNENEEEELYGD